MIHRINIFLLSLFVALAPNFIFFQAANATTVSAEGWSVSKRLVQGATTFYDGTKNILLNGKNYAATGTAAITPAAGQVAKMIVRTGAVVAVDLAIKAILGSVDYVMDPENNRVKYFVVGDPANPKDPSVHYYFLVNAFGVYKEFSSNSAAATDACQRNATGYGWKYISATPATFSATEEGIKYASCVVERSVNIGNETFEFAYQRVLNPAYNPNSQPTTEEKYLPYDTVASQIISDAVAEKADAKAYVSSVADTSLDPDEQKQIVPASDVTQQLNNSQAIPTNGTATGTSTPTTGTGDPSAPPAPPSDITLNFPVFCEWAPTVCQAAQAAISFPKTFLEKFQKWDDWLNRDTKQYTYDETKLDTQDKRTFDFSVFNENRFSVDDKCPTPEPHTFTLAGQTVSFSFDLMPVCSILEIAKPALIAASYIYAAYIVIGASRG